MAFAGIIEPFVIMQGFQAILIMKMELDKLHELAPN